MNNNFYNKLDPFSLNEDRKRRFFEKESVNGLPCLTFSFTESYILWLDTG